MYEDITNLFCFCSIFTSDFSKEADIMEGITLNGFQWGQLRPDKLQFIDCIATPMSADLDQRMKTEKIFGWF